MEALLKLLTCALLACLPLLGAVQPAWAGGTSSGREWYDEPDGASRDRTPEWFEEEGASAAGTEGPAGATEAASPAPFEYPAGAGKCRNSLRPARLRPAKLQHPLRNLLPRGEGLRDGGRPAGTGRPAGVALQNFGVSETGC